MKKSQIDPPLRFGQNIYPSDSGGPLTSFQAGVMVWVGGQFPGSLNLGGWKKGYSKI